MPPRSGQRIRANPHGGASGRVQTPDPEDKFKNFFLMIWLVDPNGVSNSKDSLDFQDYETFLSEAIRHIKNNNYNVSDLNYI